METTEGDYLFHGRWLSDYLQSRSTDIRAQVEGTPKADFETLGDDSLVARLLSDLRVEPLVLDRDNIELSTEDATLDASKDPNRAAYAFDQGFVPLPATRFAFSIPFSGTQDLWGLTPNTFGSVYARGYVRGKGSQGSLELVFTLPKDSTADLQEKLDAELRLIDQNRDRQRPEIEAFNLGLRDTIAAAVKARRKEFGGHADLAKRLGVRIRQPERVASTPGPIKRTTGVPRPKVWDVFVSYAGEDRDLVAKPLAVKSQEVVPRGS